jgi:exonuclease VII small subunit
MDEQHNPERRNYDRRKAESAITPDYEVILRTLDTLEHTVSILQRSQALLEDAVETLQKALTTLQGIIFGKDDPDDPLRRVPGLRDKVNAHDRLLQFAIYGIGGSMIVVVAHTLGLPTDILGKLLAHLIGGTP